MISRSELKAYVDDLKNRFLETPKAGLVENAISAKIDEIIREMWEACNPRGSPSLTSRPRIVTSTADGGCSSVG